MQQQVLQCTSTLVQQHPETHRSQRSHACAADSGKNRAGET
ncbi:MAG: hypothetical protein U0931_30000 [Vulcanimicrobiota bacterium]